MLCNLMKNITNITFQSPKNLETNFIANIIVYLTIMVFHLYAINRKTRT